MWNRFMTKAGWRDDRSARLQQLVAEYGLAGKPIDTVFDLFDYDEGRDPLPKGRGCAYKQLSAAHIRP
jgi:hypothetical protein